MTLRLLAHITFFDRRGTEPLAADMSKSPWKHQSPILDPTARREPLKAIRWWRDHVYHCLQASLVEMDANYTMFGSVHAIINVNADNEYAEQLPRFAIASLTARRVRIEVRPMRINSPWAAHNLSWAHRAHMAERLDQYDWFLYTEEDTLVPATALWQMLATAEPLCTCSLLCVLGRSPSIHSSSQCPCKLLPNSPPVPTGVLRQAHRAHAFFSAHRGGPERPPFLR